MSMAIVSVGIDLAKSVLADPLRQTPTGRARTMATAARSGQSVAAEVRRFGQRVQLRW